MRRFGIRSIALVTLGACAPEPVRPPAAPKVDRASSATRYRVGDWVRYRYSGENSATPVDLEETIVERHGNRLSIRVVARRGAERREWIQVVTDTPQNQETNRVDELYEVVDGRRQRLENAQNHDLYRLYEWTVFMPDGRATRTKLETRSVEFGGSTFECNTRTGENSWHGRPIRFEENECPGFLWTHGPARYVDAQSGADVWRVDVSSFGKAR